MNFDFFSYIEQNCALPAEPTEITKETYLDVMEQCLDCYTYEELIHFDMGYLHALSRILCVLGGLIQAGRKREYTDLFIRHMDYACNDIKNRVLDNQCDFAMKELMLAYKAAKGQVPDSRREQWRHNLSACSPYRTYQHQFHNRDFLHNINVYNLAGEWLRQTEGMCDTTVYFKEHLPYQLKKFDENSMYRDPGNPMLYDLTTRVQIQLINGFSYRGEFFGQLDRHLQNAGLLTLFMQSSSGEFPYGGRSNQYLFNEALIAANMEYEAARWKTANPKLAGAMKRSARLAVRSISRWLESGKHIKNFYPGHITGTDSYGNYSKYMITMGSFLYIACLSADDSITEYTAPCETGGYVFSLSDDFHKVFANCGGYALQFDTHADERYDSTGLGRIHKEGFPTELALSAPMTAAPNYMLPENAVPLDACFCPGWEQEGEILFLSSLKNNFTAALTVKIQTRDRLEFQLAYLPWGLTETYTVDPSGVSIETIFDQPLYYQIPLLVSNGRDRTKITIQGSEITVRLGTDVCRISTSGHITGNPVLSGNRNGEYQVCIIKSNASKLQTKISFQHEKGLEY